MNNLVLIGIFIYALSMATSMLLIRWIIMAEKLIGLSRGLIIHPGETLKEVLEDKEMSQRELAIRTNVKEPHISAIVKGKKPISVSFAKRLEYALGIDASFWINLQSNYEKELADYEELI